MEFHQTRTSTAFKVLKYNWIFFPLLTLVSFYVITSPVKRYFNLMRYIDRELWWNSEARTCLLLLAISHLYLTTTILLSWYPFQPNQWKDLPKRHDFRRLIICITTRGHNQRAVVETMNSLISFPAIDSRIELHLLTEEDAASKFQHLSGGFKINAVPRRFSPAKARHKARALEYFRITMKLDQEDWVLHLDEETLIDEHCLQTCLNFLQRRHDSNLKAAQGPILYNNKYYWQHWVCTVGDNIRVIEDFGRYQFQFNCLGLSLGGFHGSYLLVNGEMENAITWDTDNLLEDYIFGISAFEKGYRVGWLPSFAREQSPLSTKDYLKQRRRWYCGTIKIRRWWIRVGLILWFGIPFEMIYICWLLTIPYSNSPITLPNWVFLVISMDFSIHIVGVLVSALVQDWDSGMGWLGISLSIFRVPLLLPVVRLLEFSAMMYALIFPTQKFEIIQK